MSFQYKYYWPIAIGLSFLLPFIIGFYYGRPFGGLLWGGFLRLTLVHHFTFFINSLCHYAGTRPFESNISARDSWWVSYLTFGEGFHNYHHKFQWDYRNGIRWYDFDPGKWIVKFLSYFGLTTDIRKVEEYQILNAKMDGLIKSMQVNYQKIPEEIQKIYQIKIEEIQGTAIQVYKSWQEMEKEFKLLKANKISKLKLNTFKKQRKLFRLEYVSSLNMLSILLIGIQNGNYIQN